MTSESTSRGVASLLTTQRISLLYVAFMLIIAGCAAAKVASPGQSDVDRVQNKYPGYTVADLHRGQSLFETNCQSCHPLKEPASKTEAQWQTIVPAMVKKVNKKTTVLD